MLLKVLLEINPIDQNRKIVALKKRRISIVWLFQISWKKSKISWWTTFFCSTSAGLVLDGSIDIFKLSTLKVPLINLSDNIKNPWERWDSNPGQVQLASEVALQYLVLSSTQTVLSIRDLPVRGRYRWHLMSLARNCSAVFQNNIERER